VTNGVILHSGCAWCSSELFLVVFTCVGGWSFFVFGGISVTFNCD
jgi:hypothetical protein